MGTPFPDAVWSKPENPKPPALQPTPTHHPPWRQFPRIHMEMKTSIFPQTHTGPSNPPRALHNGPQCHSPATCWIFPGKGEKGWRRRGFSSQPPAPFAPWYWESGSESARAPSSPSTLSLQWLAPSVLSPAKWYPGHSVAGRILVGMALSDRPKKLDKQRVGSTYRVALLGPHWQKEDTEAQQRQSVCSKPHSPRAAEP